MSRIKCSLIGCFGGTSPHSLKMSLGLWRNNNTVPLQHYLRTCKDFKPNELQNIDSLENQLNDF